MCVSRGQLIYLDWCVRQNSAGLSSILDCLLQRWFTCVCLVTQSCLLICLNEHLQCGSPRTPHMCMERCSNAAQQMRRSWRRLCGSDSVNSFAHSFDLLTIHEDFIKLPFNIHITLIKVLLKFVVNPSSRQSLPPLTASRTAEHVVEHSGENMDCHARRTWLLLFARFKYGSPTS